MKVIVNALRRIIIQGGAGVIFGLQTSIRQTLVATKDAVKHSAAVVVTQTKRLAARAQAGIRASVHVLGSARAEHSLGIVHGTSINPEPIEQAGAIAMTQVAVTNTTIYEIESVSQLSGDTWDDIENFEGNTEPEASLTGGTGLGGLTPKDGDFRGVFASPNASKDNQTINSVTLEFYRRQTGTLLGNGTLSAVLSGAMAKAVDSQSGDVDGLVTLDLTADVGQDWNKLRGLNIDISGSSALLGRSCYARRARVIVESERLIAL